ncbi:MAG: hypothetical protein HY720_02325 [Planctomycetes bacterium]|nr:hypothetical protein [Planctomycetota bacterium]
MYAKKLPPCGVLGISALFALVLAPVAEPQESGPSRESQDLASFVDRLALTPGEIQEIVLRAEEAARIREWFDDYDREHLFELTEMFRELLPLVESDEMIPEDLANRIGPANHEWQMARKTFLNRIASLEEKVSRGLAEKQIRLLSNYRCGDPRASLSQRVARDARPGPGSRGRTSVAESSATRRQDLHREMEEIRRERYGSIGGVGEFLLEPGLLARLDPERERTPDVDPELEEARGETRRLREEINLHNLLNGLHLDRDQMNQILALNLQGTAERGCVRPGTTASQNGGTRWWDVNGRAGGDPRSSAALVGILEPAQIEMIAGYEPCLLPSEGLVNPVLVGQAGENPVGEKELDRVRGLPPEDYKYASGQVIRKVLRSVEQRNGGPLDAQTRATIEARFRESMERARELDDPDYAIQKADLLEVLSEADRARNVQEEIRSVESDLGSEMTAGAKAAQFLLCPSIVPLIEARLARLDEARPISKIDLASIEAAPSCEGGCALKE